MLIAVLISQCSFAAVTYGQGLLRLEGLMVSMGLDSGKVQKLGSPSGSANFGRSRDVATWRGTKRGAFLPSSGYNNRLYACRLLIYLRGSGKENEIYIIITGIV